MRRRAVLASALLGLPTFGLAQNLAGQALAANDPKLLNVNDPPKLTVSIAIPEHHGKRSLNEYDHFHVLVTNHSPRAVKLWTDKFSWGYDNLSFEMVDDQGQTTQIQKKARDWSKNYPDWLSLAVGESYVIGVNFFSAQAGDIWEGLPERRPNNKPGPIHLKLKAVYKVTPDRESEELKVWTGRLESPQQVYTIW